MQKRTREILAVLLLGLLLVVGVSILGYYLFIGHNWNVAASNIDDSIGQMDGYTVVLYQGTRVEPEDDNGKKDPTSQGSSRQVSSGSGAAEGAVSSANSATEGAASSAGSEAQGVTPRSETPSGTTSNAAMSSSGSASKAAPEQPNADVQSVADSYREKGANVFVVDAADLSRYTEPFIVAKNGMRIGFMSVGNSELRSHARANSQCLAELKPNYTVAVTDDVSLHRVAADGLIGNVSVIVCDDQKGEFPNGRYEGPTYCVCAPEVDEVGAVIVSPSGVMSTKTIDGQQDL